MLSLTEFFIFSATLLTSFLIILKRNRERNGGRRYPPSLPSLPIVGSLPFIKGFDNLGEFLMKKISELGPVFTLQIGSRFILVLNTLEAIEDAFINHGSSFSDREGFFIEKFCNKQRKGLVSMHYNAEFRRYRKFSLSIMKEFGFGSRNKSEHLILTEVSELVDHINMIKGKEFDPAEMIILSSTNVILNMFTGRRQTFEEGLSEMHLTIDKGVKLLEPALDIFPVLRFLPYYHRRFDELNRCHWILFKLIETEIEMILQDESLDCFVSRYIKKEGPDYDHEQLVYTIRDIVVASTDSTSTVLLWTFVYLANNPSVTERVQKEIDSVVPRDRLPSTDDQPNLPFTEATILEIMRIRTPIPYGVPHMTSKDTEVLGYFVPANTVVIPNIASAHMDKSLWSDAEVFRPERFLDEDNKLIHKHRVISFSLGRRSCPGEALGRHQLFLFISGLLQNFSFLPSDGIQSIPNETVQGAVARPFTFTMRMIPRKRFGETQTL